MEMNEDDIAEKNYRSTLPGPLGAIDTWISRTESVILAMGVILMAINTIANVLSRFILGESLHFSEEVNRILIVMITFAASAMRHVTVAISACRPSTMRSLLAAGAG